MQVEKEEANGVAFLDKTLRLIREGRIQRISKTLCFAESSSSDLPTFYAVRKVNEKWVCNCRGFKERGGRCSHSLAAFLMEEQAQKLG